MSTVADAAAAAKSSTNRGDNGYVSDAEIYSDENAALGDETGSGGAAANYYVR